MNSEFLNYFPPGMVERSWFVCLFVCLFSSFTNSLLEMPPKCLRLLYKFENSSIKFIFYMSYEILGNFTCFLVQQVKCYLDGQHS